MIRQALVFPRSIKVAPLSSTKIDCFVVQYRFCDKDDKILHNSYLMLWCNKVCHGWSRLVRWCSSHITAVYLDTLARVLDLKEGFLIYGLARVCGNNHYGVRNNDTFCNGHIESWMEWIRDCLNYSIMIMITRFLHSESEPKIQGRAENKYFCWSVDKTALGLRGCLWGWYQRKIDLHT